MRCAVWSKEDVRCGRRTLPSPLISFPNNLKGVYGPLWTGKLDLDRLEPVHVVRSKKLKKKPKENQGFLVPRPSNFEAKFNKKRTQTDQNSSKNLVSILIEFLMDFGS